MGWFKERDPRVERKDIPVGSVEQLKELEHSRRVAWSEYRSNTKMGCFMMARDNLAQIDELTRRIEKLGGE